MPRGRSSSRSPAADRRASDRGSNDRGCAGTCRRSADAAAPAPSCHTVRRNSRPSRPRHAASGSWSGYRLPRSNPPVPASHIYPRSDNRKRDRPDRRRAPAARALMNLPANCGVFGLTEMRIASQFLMRPKLLRPLVAISCRMRARLCGIGQPRHHLAEIVALHPARQQVLRADCSPPYRDIDRNRWRRPRRARPRYGRASHRRGPNCRGRRASCARPAHEHAPRARPRSPRRAPRTRAFASSRRCVK